MFRARLSDVFCPLCHSQVSELIVDLKESGLPYRIRGCLDCTNAWTFPAPEFVEYDREDFHAESIASNSEETTKTIADLPHEWQQSINMQVSLIKRHIKPRARILEIGCGEGILLSELADSGFAVRGIEPSLTASSRAKSKGGSNKSSNCRVFEKEQTVQRNVAGRYQNLKIKLPCGSFFMPKH